MAFLLSPININGNLLCCQESTNRTEAVLSGSAKELGINYWEIFQSNGPATSGQVKFGTCCAKRIKFILNGQVEIRNPNYDWIEVYINDILVFKQASVKNEGSGSDSLTENLGPIELNFNLTPTPCGNVIEIKGSTQDSTANNDVWWRVFVEIL